MLSGWSRVECLFEQRGWLSVSHWVSSASYTGLSSYDVFQAEFHINFSCQMVQGDLISTGRFPTWRIVFLGAQCDSGATDLHSIRALHFYIFSDAIKSYRAFPSKYIFSGKYIFFRNHFLNHFFRWGHRRNSPISWSARWGQFSQVVTRSHPNFLFRLISNVLYSKMVTKVDLIKAELGNSVPNPRFWLGFLNWVHFFRARMVH